MEVLSQCPLCKQESFRTYLEVPDYMLTKELFSIKECTTCSLKLTNPRPDHKDILSYYKSDNYNSHKGSFSSLAGMLYSLSRSWNHWQKRRLINSFSKDYNTLLDVGCGTGSFLRYMSAKGWEVSGIEPVEKARELASRHKAVQVYRDFQELPPGHFGLITLWHVLEHLPDLTLSMARLKSRLSPEGLLVIAIPNHASPDAKYYGKYWAGYDVPRHLYHFSKTTMKKLLVKHGFQLEAVKPLFLDAIYVSMLSEKYQGHSFPLFKGLKQGVRSNWKARASSNQSSLIYICRHA